MPGRINGFSLAYTVAGGIVLWSGIKGGSISQTFKSLLSGTRPTANTEQITDTAFGGPADTTSPAGSTASAPGRGYAARIPPRLRRTRR